MANLNVNVNVQSDFYSDQIAQEGAICEISPVSLATEPVDRCIEGWLQHITEDGKLRVRCVEPFRDLTDVSAISEYKGYINGGIYTDFFGLKKNEILISNPSMLEQISKTGKSFFLKVVFILKDPMCGNKVTFEAIQA